MTNNTDILNELFQHDLTPQIEGDLIAMLNEWHSLPEVWDNELDAQIHRWYSNPPKVFPKRPYFSPSAATKCPRELYMKALQAKKDVVKKQPHQSRWQGIGTAIGSYVQREILSIERNFEKLTGNKPRFTFERNEDGTPMFEEFAGKSKLIEHNGEQFYLYGFPDGIMRYVTDSGEVVRVGLEIKSKQQSPSKTSIKSLRRAEHSHEVQTALYAEMFDVDYYVILYLNASKRAWSMTEEEYSNFPDIRAFCRRITDADKTPLFDKFSTITKAVREKNPPPIDLDEWRFNEYKQAIALDLTEEEYCKLEQTNDRLQYSNLPDWKKRQYAEAIEYITEVRSG